MRPEYEEQGLSASASLSDALNRAVMLTVRDARPADDERHLSVLAVRQCLACRDAVLADVVPVIRTKYYIGVVQFALGLKNVEELVDHLVHARECLRTSAVGLVAECNRGIVHEWELADPGGFVVFHRIEVGRAGCFEAGVEILVTLQGDRGPSPGLVGPTSDE